MKRGQRGGVGAAAGWSGAGRRAGGRHAGRAGALSKTSMDTSRHEVLRREMRSITCRKEPIGRETTGACVRAGWAEALARCAGSRPIPALQSPGCGRVRANPRAPATPRGSPLEHVGIMHAQRRAWHTPESIPYPQARARARVQIVQAVSGRTHLGMRCVKSARSADELYRPSVRSSILHVTATAYCASGVGRLRACGSDRCMSSSARRPRKGRPFASACTHVHAGLMRRSSAIDGTCCELSDGVGAATS